MNRRLLKSVVFAVAGMVLPTVVSANDGMPPSIFALVQEGRNVTVTLQIADPGDPGIALSYALKRSSEVETVTVFEDRVFDPAEAEYESEPTCRWWEPLNYWCTDVPEACDDCDGNGYGDCFGECAVDESTGETLCEEHADACDLAPITCDDDCDGDGTVDCYGWCRTVYRFDVVDACVPAGNYEYALFYRQNDTDEWLDVWDGAGTIGVTDSGEACEDTGSEGGSDGTGDDDASGCSVSTFGAPSVLMPFIRSLLKPAPLI